MSESVDIIIPTIGESIKVAYIAEVFKNVGDEVEQGDALFSVDSDKATLEVPAPCSGVVTALSIEEGDELDIGSKVGAIQKGASGTKSSTSSTEAAPKAESVEVAKGQQTGPAARLEADRLNVDLGSVQGSGVRGRVLSQ